MQLTQPIIEDESETNTEVDANGWPIGFFEATAGVFQDEPLVRAPQGEYEEHLELE